jgi:hypothetical protein
MCGYARSKSRKDIDDRREWEHRGGVRHRVILHDFIFIILFLLLLDNNNSKGLFLVFPNTTIVTYTKLAAPPVWLKYAWEMTCRGPLRLQPVSTFST